MVLCPAPSGRHFSPLGWSQDQTVLTPKEGRLLLDPICCASSDNHLVVFCPHSTQSKSTPSGL